jgi:AAA15 family ATPase/GTPase
MIGFQHSAAHEGFAWADESDGTRRMMHLLPVLWDATNDPRRAVFVVDELERSLHAALTRHFVEAFLGAGDGRPGQLIFTTHDTNLLNDSLLPAGSVWFTEKDRAGGTHLYSLAEYPPEQLERFTDRLERGYLQGRFGAIPVVGVRHNAAHNRRVVDA